MRSLSLCETEAKPFSTPDAPPKPELKLVRCMNDPTEQQTLQLIMQSNERLNKRSRNPFNLFCFDCKAKLGARGYLNGSKKMNFFLSYTACICTYRFISPEFISIQKERKWLKIVKILEEEGFKISKTTLQELIDQQGGITKARKVERIIYPLHVPTLESIEERGAELMNCKMSQLRDYQVELVVGALAVNTLIYLPTGCGKTLIAIKVMEEFAALNPKRITVFLVPTRPLVSQQAQYVRRESNLMAIELMGQTPTLLKDLVKIREKIALDESVALVITPQLFFNLLFENRLYLSDVSLLIFDEAHHAIGDHPYAEILNLLSAQDECDRPRLMGLSASPYGNKAGEETGSAFLHQLLRMYNATLDTPSLTARDWVNNFVPKDAKWVIVEESAREKHIRIALRNYIDSFASILNAASSSLEHCLLMDYDTDDTSRAMFVGRLRLTLINNTTMSESYKRICKHVLTILSGFETLSVIGATQTIIALRTRFNQIRGRTTNAGDRDLYTILAPAYHMYIGPLIALYTTKKELLMEELASRVNMISNLIQQMHSNDGSRGIVFVRTRQSARLIATVMSQIPTLRVLNPTKFVGQHYFEGMSWEHEQRPILEKFRQGQIRLLIATNVLEEGIDVPECSFVIRFDGVAGVKSLIQSRGRARCKYGSFMILCTQKEKEKQEKLLYTERNMVATARLLAACHPAKYTASKILQVEQGPRLETCPDAQQSVDDVPGTWNFVFGTVIESTVELIVDGSFFKRLSQQVNVVLLDKSFNLCTARGDLSPLSQYNELCRCLEYGSLKDGVTYWTRYESDLTETKAVFEMDTVVSPKSQTSATIISLCRGKFTDSMQIFVRKENLLHDGLDGTFFLSDNHCWVEIIDEMVITFHFSALFQQICWLEQDVLTDCVHFYMTFKTPPYIEQTGSRQCIDFDRQALSFCFTCKLESDEMLDTIRRHLKKVGIDVRDTKFTRAEAPVGENCASTEQLWLPFRTAYALECFCSRVCFTLGDYLPATLLEELAKLSTLNQEQALYIFDPKGGKSLEAEFKEFLTSEFLTDGSIENQVFELTSPQNVVFQIMVTPSRILYLPPLATTENRMFRHFGSSKFMYVHFRDENNERLELKHEAILTRMEEFLTRGITLKYTENKQNHQATFQFVGCSMSQVRDCCCIFTLLDPYAVRAWAGSISPKYAPAEYLKRLSRVFTSTMEAYPISDIVMENLKADVTNDTYTFTDGCGEISVQSANGIANVLEMKQVPCAFQIRLGGAKGVLVTSDFQSEAPKETGICLRHSMMKFETNHRMLEIVSYSSQSPAYLSRQSIQLLSDLKVPDNVFIKLQEDYLESLRVSFASEEDARTTLKSDLLNPFKSSLINLTARGMSVMDDEYLRSVLHATYAYKVQNVVHRARILIPKARVMMGVADFTGTLEYGQVFVQYSEQESDEKRINVILDQVNVVVHRNPCHHPGDIRVLRCRADVPEQLKRLVDVIVFPVSGPRPHPDECTGGDLDGDMYSVIWDEKLIPRLENVTEAMDFFAEKKKNTDNVEMTQSVLIKAFISMVYSSVLGIASNAHLALCDYSEKGSFDPSAIKLAWICSQQVDGYRLEEHLQIIRELSPPTYPDFMESERLSHRSSKILGKLYRSSKILTLLDHSCLKHDEQHVNDDFMVGNYTKYVALTKILYRQYCRSIAALLRMSGAVLEGELASGLIVRTDDLYRTDYFRFGERCRDAFFRNVRQYRKIFSVLCKTLNEFERCELASAWYYAIFSLKNGENRFLSFGWIIMDELLMNYSINQAQTRTTLHSPPAQNMETFVSKLQVSMMANLELARNDLLSEYFDRLQARSAVECSISPMLTNRIHIILFGSSALLLNEKVSDLDLMIHAPKDVDLHAVKHVLASTLYKDTILKDEMRVPILKFVLERWDVEMCTYVNGPLKTHLFRAYAMENAFFWPCLYFLLKWGRCSAFVKRGDKRGENFFSPTTFIWLFVGFCLHKNFMHRISPDTIQLEALLEEANDMNKQVSLWNTLLRDVLVNSSTSSPTSAQVLWEFLKFYADSFTPTCFYACHDPYDATNNTQLDDRSIEIFKSHCQVAMHRLLLYRGRVDCLLVKSTNHSTRIILSRALSRRILCAPNFFAKKLLLECNAPRNTKLEFTSHSNQLRKHLLVAEVAGDGGTTQWIEKKLELFELELGGSLKLHSTNRSYFRENAGLLLFEGALSQDEKIGFSSYFKECNLHHEEFPLHQAHLLCYAHSRQWYKHACVTFQTKFMQQMIRLGHFSETYPNALHPKALIRFGYHYLIHLPRSFHEETLIHATIQRLDEEFERGRIAYDLYRAVLTAKMENYANIEDSLKVEDSMENEEIAHMEDFANAEDPMETEESTQSEEPVAKNETRDSPAEKNNSSRRRDAPLRDLLKVARNDKGVTHSFYPKIHAMLLPAVTEYVSNRLQMSYVETTSSYSVSLIYRGFEYVAHLSDELVFVSLRTRPCRWFCSTLKMRQEFEETSSYFDPTPDVRYYVSTSEELQQDDVLYLKLLQACDKAADRKGILEHSNDSKCPIRISDALQDVGINASAIPTIRHVTGRRYYCADSKVEISILQATEYTAPILHNLEKGFHRIRHKNEVEVYMPPLDMQVGLSPAYAETFLSTGVKIAEFLRTFTTLSTAIQQPGDDLFGQ
ncbi:hypothetical protein ABG067_004100 [Albugo candida]